jgi:hypothetical protein
VAPSSLKTVGKRLFLPHRLRQLFAALNTYYERNHCTPSFRTVSYLHRIREYISSREASLTSASLVPLTEHTLPPAKYEFATVCENWARSYNLDIFNDLAEPFQTQPAPLVPVHQGGAEVPVHQGKFEPVQQAIDESSYNPPQQEHASNLPNLPALEGSHQPLSIEAAQPLTTAIEPTADLDLVSRDRTPETSAALIQLPPTPPSHEVTLHNVPLEAESKEITLADASPKVPQFYSARDPSAQSASESSQPDHSDISSNELDQAFGTLNIMSPGNPPAQPERLPEFNAAMADELQRLGAEMDQMRSERYAESLEVQNLRAIQAANAQALQHAEANFREESLCRKELEDAATAKPRISAQPLSGLASFRHAPSKGKLPDIGKAGPSNWNQAQQAAAPTYQTAPHRTGIYPNQFSTWQPPDLSSNPFLRAPCQPQWAAPPAAPPAAPHAAPPARPPNADFLTEISQLQVLFAKNQHAVNEQILGTLATQAAAPASRSVTALKASDIGMFEPTAQPDADAAIVFLDNIRDAVKQYSEERVMRTMKRCCTNAVALNWLTGLNEADRDCHGSVSWPGWQPSFL